MTALKILLVLCTVTLASTIAARAQDTARGQSDSLKPTDVTVWVNTRSHVYHCPGTRYYGATAAGTYMGEGQARQTGNRPAYGRPCAPLSDSAATATRSAPPTTQPQPPPSTVQVWVNTGSGVYHCPGSRYYGNTRLGTYMTEAAARAAGHRPAYGKPCS